MVELADSSVLAQLRLPDIEIAVALLLSWPERFAHPLAPPRCSTAVASSASSTRPEQKPLHCPGLRRRAAAGGTMPAVMNAANEQAVACSSTSAFTSSIFRPDRAGLANATVGRGQADPSLSDVGWAVDAWRAMPCFEASGQPGPENCCWPDRPAQHHDLTLP